jgi:hypothetical protein
VSEPLWVAKLVVSQATRAKLSSKHNLDADEVLDAIVCTGGLYYQWDDDPERGRRAMVQVYLRGVEVIVVLYPVESPSGDVYALGSAYPKR